MKVKIYHKVKTTTVLGKGKRYALYFQGCPHRCEGCIVPDSWDIKNGEEVLVEYLADEINSLDIDGVTISGGEPFFQYEALNYLLDLLDERLDIVVYSGYLFEDIEKNFKNVLYKIDLLIDGKYIKELDVNEPLIGSLNQKVYILSKRGKKLAEYMQNQKSREVEFVSSNSNLFMVGIPTKKLKEIL